MFRLRSMLLATVFTAATLATVTGCSGAPDDTSTEDESSTGALQQGEVEASIIADGVSVPSPSAQGIDEWKASIVKMRGKDDFVVLTAFEGHGADRKPVVEFALDKETVTVRAPDPEKPLSLTQEQLHAIGEDMQKFKTVVDEQHPLCATETFHAAIRSLVTVLAGAGTALVCVSSVTVAVGAIACVGGVVLTADLAKRAFESAKTARQACR